MSQFNKKTCSKNCQKSIGLRNGLRAFRQGLDEDEHCKELVRTPSGPLLRQYIDKLTQDGKYPRRYIQEIATEFLLN